MKLYRHKECCECGAIQETLDELVMPYETLYPKDATRQVPGEDGRLPVLVDEGRRFVVRDPILRHLEELRQFREQWYKYQSDACYCEE